MAPPAAPLPRFCDEDLVACGGSTQPTDYGQRERELVRRLSSGVRQPRHLLIAPCLGKQLPVLLHRWLHPRGLRDVLYEWSPDRAIMHAQLMHGVCTREREFRDLPGFLTLGNQLQRYLQRRLRGHRLRHLLFIWTIDGADLRTEPLQRDSAVQRLPRQLPFHPPFGNQLPACVRLGI